MLIGVAFLAARNGVNRALAWLPRPPPYLAAVSTRTDGRSRGPNAACATRSFNACAVGMTTPSQCV